MSANNERTVCSPLLSVKGFLPDVSGTEIACKCTVWNILHLNHPAQICRTRLQGLLKKSYLCPECHNYYKIVVLWMFYIVKSVNALVYFELFWSATTEHHGVSGDSGLHYILSEIIKKTPWNVCLPVCIKLLVKQFGSHVFLSLSFLW